MGLFAGSQEILAVARYSYVALFWRTGHAYRRFRNSTFHLHAFLERYHMPEAILGISAYYHDSAASLLIDGDIIAAAQEERFTRIKHDSSFPSNAVKYVLNEGGVKIEDLSAIAFYDKPYLKFERLLETYHGFAPKGLKSFLSAIPVWIKEKLFMRDMLWSEIGKIGQGNPRLLFPEHHLSHAASAFYPSPFEESAIVGAQFI